MKVSAIDSGFKKQCGFQFHCMCEQYIVMWWGSLWRSGQSVVKSFKGDNWEMQKSFTEMGSELVLKPENEFTNLKIGGKDKRITYPRLLYKHWYNWGNLLPVISKYEKLLFHPSYVKISCYPFSTHPAIMWPFQILILVDSDICYFNLCSFSSSTRLWTLPCLGPPSYPGLCYFSYVLFNELDSVTIFTSYVTQLVSS